MTSNFIPYLPSSPPPLDDDDDDDDEFGSFTIANHLCNSKVNECKGLSLTGKTAEKEIEATEILHNNACDRQNKADCLNDSDFKCPPSDRADLTNTTNTDDGPDQITELEEDSNSGISTNIYSQVSDETELSSSPVKHNSVQVKCENAPHVENTVDPTNDTLHQSEDIPDSLDTTSRTEQFSEEQSLRSTTHADKSTISSTETNYSSTVNNLNSSDDGLSDKDKRRDDLNDTINSVSDGADSDFGNFVSIAQASTFQLNDSSTNFDGCAPTTELNISNASVNDPNANKEKSDDRREDEELESDVTNVEQWDGFLSCPQSASVADDDDDDEFSDFVCPPSDDNVQISNFSVDTAWPTGEDTREEDKSSVASGNSSRKHSLETFHPTFEAHFSDTVSQCGTKLSVTYSLDKISQIVLSSFPTCSALEEEDCNNLDSIKDATDKLDDADYNVWPYVCDIDKMNALTYQWSNSSGNKKFLTAINIDSRNLLFGHNWNSSVPLFAANLSLNPLEPIKTPLKSADTEENGLFSPPPQEVLPPAQFDWNSSGLINPLDASNGVSALLDLDFFFTNETGSVNPVPSATWSLENELLGSDANKEDNEHKQFNSRVSPLLEQILSNAKLSASNYTKMKQSTAHTPEAQVVLNKLPDLSFMQAKVLMFPIRSSSP